MIWRKGKEMKENRNEIMNDREVADLLGVSVWMLQKRCRTGFRKGEIDILKAEPLVIGGMRRWLRGDVMRVLQAKPRVG